MGDFNVTPSTALLRPIQERMQDASSTLGEVFSFPVQAPKRKIDYIFVTEGLAANVAKVEAWTTEHSGIYLSDHYPIAATFNL